MKYLIILTIVCFCAALIYLRLRPYIALVRQALGVVRAARGLNMNDRSAGTPPRPPQNTGEPLVRCTACGAWLPASRALVFRATKATYCSSACMERSAGGQARSQSARGL